MGPCGQPPHAVLDSLLAHRHVDTLRPGEEEIGIGIWLLPEDGAYIGRYVGSQLGGQVERAYLAALSDDSDIAPAVHLPDAADLDGESLPKTCAVGIDKLPEKQVPVSCLRMHVNSLQKCPDGSLADARDPLSRTAAALDVHHIQIHGTVLRVRGLEIEKEGPHRGEPAVARHWRPALLHLHPEEPVLDDLPGKAGSPVKVPGPYPLHLVEEGHEHVHHRLIDMDRMGTACQGAAVQPLIVYTGYLHCLAVIFPCHIPSVFPF